jgi:hypothetical protein
MKTQIKEMAEIIRNANSVKYPKDYFYPEAKVLYRAGYRKASDVASEIFEELEKTLGTTIWLHCDPWKYDTYKELKRKYTEGK